MIDLSAKIHDKFTLEFKVGFNTEETQHPLNVNDFVMNTWIFVPNSLDINAVKYSKDNFYRKKVQLWRKQLAKASPFPQKGINDIIRYNITEFTRKMDNPTLPLSGSWEEDGYKPIVGEKIYRLTFVFQCVFEDQTEYKRVLVLCNKNGILEVN